MIPLDTFKSACDNAHFLGGACLVLVSHVLGLGWLFGLVVTLLWATGKEAWYDPIYETDEVAGGLTGGIRDWLGYVLGAASAVAVVLVRGLF